MNFLPVTVASVNDSGTTVKLPDDSNVTIPVVPGLKVGDRATLGIRPEHLQLNLNGATLNGEVLVVERLGGETYLYLRISGGDTLVVRADGANTSHVGDHVPIQIDGAACHLFDANGEAVSKAHRQDLASIR
jgi:multiple sugar transport system ATP-binding protein